MSLPDGAEGKETKSKVGQKYCDLSSGIQMGAIGFPKTQSVMP